MRTVAMILAIAMACCRGEPVDLHRAIALGDEQAVLQCLEMGPSERVHDEVDGETPLAAAIRADRATIAEILMGHGADPNTTLPDGTLPLHFVVERALRRLNPVSPETMMPASPATKDAVDGGDVSAARWVGILAGGRVALRVDTATAAGTALQRAVTGRLPQVVKTLVKAGAALNLARTTDGLTPLEIAVSNGQNAVVAALIEAGAAPPDGPCPDRTAVGSLRFELQPDEVEARATARLAFPTAGRSVAGSGAERNALCESRLEVAVMERSLESLQDLALHADADAVRRAFGRALQLGFQPEVEALLKAGVRPEASHVALGARHGRVDAVGAFLARGLTADGDTSDRTPFCEAASRRHEAVVALLLTAGAAANGRAGSPSVLCAVEGLTGEARHGRETMAVLDRLVRAGADLQVADVDGETALHKAARAGQTELSMWLVERGLDPERASTGPMAASARTVALQAGHSALAQRLEQSRPRPGNP